ncbi:outer membrane beta-barrel protein [Hymenobacter monticola]|uniref:PorT family protein n=1 Tax=Hymenobacter monticola TaxID=1705399 RepID=A0ABY4B2L5_9BACT|nr:outer membrane beta-barrel protein [Hymenobacter monticola]UOE32597.1 PorT family protein [Hymenobacter monticola]
MKHGLLALATFVAVGAAPAAHAQTTISFGLRLGANYASRSGDDPKYSPVTGTNSGTATVAVTSQQDYNRKAIFAPQFGAVLDVRFGKLALQPAVLFSQKGVDQTLKSTATQTSSFNGFPGSKFVYNDSFHSTSRANYLEIPINVVYTSGTDHGFQLFAGPYVAFGVGGRTEIENEGSVVSTNGSFTSTNNYYSYGNTFFIYRDNYPGAPTTNSSTGTGGQSTTVNASFEATSGAVVARRFDAGLNAGIGYRFSALQVQLGYGLGLVNQQTGKAPTFRDDLPAYYQRVAHLTATYFIKGM